MSDQHTGFAGSVLVSLKPGYYKHAATTRLSPNYLNLMIGRST